MKNLKRLLNESKKLRALAHKEINDLAQGKKKFTMSIPPNKGDTYLILQDVIDDSEVKDKIIKTMAKYLLY